MQTARRRAEALCLPLTLPTGNVSTTVVAPSSGAAFTLVTAAVGRQEAQEVCNAQGGHLASYSSVEEQAEVRPCCRPATAAAGRTAQPELAHAEPHTLQLACCPDQATVLHVLECTRSAALPPYCS